MYSANPPPEVISLLESNSLPPEAITGWFAVPILTPSKNRLSMHEIETTGLVNAYALLLPFFDNPIFHQSIRILDVLNGCAHQCDQCLVDAALPTKMFSVDSLEQLFEDARFVAMLQPDSLRLGSTGDLLNHPDAERIIRLILEATSGLAEKRRGLDYSQRYKIRIITNYRKHHEQQLDKLIQLVLEFPSRISLCFSTPLNRTDVVNSQFQDFVLDRPTIFGSNFSYSDNGLINFGFGVTPHRDIMIQDVRHSTNLSLGGRSLPLSEVQRIHPECGVILADRFLNHQHRGHVKVYLNPDAFWLHVYGTMQESHTTRVYTPLKPENIDVLCKLGFHPDFPTPPNWPGGKGVFRERVETNKIQQLARLNGIDQITGRII